MSESDKVPFHIQKYSREQVKKALELYDSGTTMRQVARDLNFPSRTVQGWVNAHKDGRPFIFPMESRGERPIEEVFEEENRIRYLEDKLSRLENKYRARTRESSQLMALLDAIREVVPTRKPVPVPKPPAVRRKETIESAVLALGCIHWGENVDAQETGGISTYNEIIAEKRFNYTIDKAIHISQEILTGYHIRKLHVFGLGDFVSGEIHDELIATNESSVVEQVLDCVDILQTNLLKLCQVFPKVEFTGVVGNHGRLDPKKYFKLKAVKNYDFMIYSILEKLLADQPNISFNIPRSFWYIQAVENLRFMIIHGDQVRSWMGIPFYGLVREYLKWRALAESYAGGFHHLICGHFHTPNMITVQKDRIFINGSTKGGDEFSLGAISAASDPVQLFFGVNPKHGISWTYQLNSGLIK